MTRYVILAALVATLAAGCSTKNPQSAAADDDDKTFVTGSHIPNKDKTTVKAVTDRNSIDDMTRKNNAYVPPAGAPR